VPGIDELQVRWCRYHFLQLAPVKPIALGAAAATIAMGTLSARGMIIGAASVLSVWCLLSTLS